MAVKQVRRFQALRSKRTSCTRNKMLKTFKLTAHIGKIDESAQLVFLC